MRILSNLEYLTLSSVAFRHNSTRGGVGFKEVVFTFRQTIGKLGVLAFIGKVMPKSTFSIYGRLVINRGNNTLVIGRKTAC